MCGGAKADGSALGGVLCGELATLDESRGVVTAPGNATSGMLAMSSGGPATSSGTPAASSDAQVASSSSTAATGKEAAPTVVLTDEAEEEGSEGRHLTGGCLLYTLERASVPDTDASTREATARRLSKGRFSPNYICS